MVYTPVMSEATILSLIDEEIARLREVRSLLASSEDVDSKSPAITRSRQAGKHLNAQPRSGRRSKRKMSPEGRARIAAAQKKRWAALKKAKSTAK